ncbi:hypothetical protein U1Q18_000072 [Sarracenia purpurea var. burkii]
MESQIQIHDKNTKPGRRGAFLELNSNPEVPDVAKIHQSIQNPTREGRSSEIQSHRQNTGITKIEMVQNISSPSFCAQTDGDLPTPGFEEKSWKEEEEYGSIHPKLQNLPPRGYQNQLSLIQPVGNKNMEAFLSFPGTEKENGLLPPSKLLQTKLSGPNQFPSQVYPPNQLTEAEVKPSVRKPKSWARQVRQTPGTDQQTHLCSKRQLDEEISLTTPNLAKKAKTQTNLLPNDPLEIHAPLFCQQTVEAAKQPRRSQ